MLRINLVKAEILSTIQIQVLRHLRFVIIGQVYNSQSDLDITTARITASHRKIAGGDFIRFIATEYNMLHFSC